MREFRGRSLAYRSFVWFLLLTTTSFVAPGTWIIPGAAVVNAFVSLEHEGVGTRIIGSDIDFVVKASGSVDSVSLFLRKMEDLGEFTQFEMERSETPGEWHYTLPLSQEPVRTRIEYYFEAYTGDQKVAVTESFYIRFIEQPYVGEPQVVTTAKLSKDEWKVLLRGGKRPFWQKWWVWAIAGVVVAGAVAATASSSSTGTPALVATAQGVFTSTAGANVTIEGNGTSDVIVGGFGNSANATITVTPSGGKAPYMVTFTADGNNTGLAGCADIAKGGTCESTTTYSFGAGADYRDQPITITVSDSDNGTDDVIIVITPIFLAG